MTDEPPKQPYGIGWYAAWIVLALVLYVLAYGPVQRLYSDRRLPDYALIPHAPVFEFWKRFPGAYSAVGLEWWDDLWHPPMLPCGNVGYAVEDEEDDGVACTEPAE